MLLISHIFHVTAYYISCWLSYLQLCKLVPLQRYTKSLTNLQRASLVEKSRQKPPERMTSLTTVGLLTVIFETLKRFLFTLIYVLIHLAGS